MKLYHNPLEKTLAIKVAEETITKAVDLLLETRPEWLDELINEIGVDPKDPDSDVTYLRGEISDHIDQILMAYGEAALILSGAPRPGLIVVAYNTAERIDDPTIVTPADVL